MTTTDALEQLFDNDFVVTTVTLAELPGKPPLTAKLKSLTSTDFLKLDDLMVGLTGSKMKVTQKYALHKLSLCLLEYKDLKVDPNHEDRHDIVLETLLKMPGSLIDKLLQEHSKLEMLLKKALQLTEIDINFFDQGDSPTKPEQPLGESPQDKTEASKKQ